MRRICIALFLTAFTGAAAIAADIPARMPAKAPAMVPVPVFTWTGFYIGLHAGYGWGDSSWVDDPALTGLALGSHKISGALAGGQIGYNWQTGPWVFGIEADAAWADIKGSHVDQFLSDLHTKLRAVGTVTGRVGHAWNNHLLYVKGGGAWGSFKYDDFFTLGGPLNGASSNSRWGWTAGAGWEYGFTRNWSVKVEYNYLDFGSDTFTFNGGIGGVYLQTIDNHVHVVKGGVNYRFGG